MLKRKEAHKHSKHGQIELLNEIYKMILFVIFFYSFFILLILLLLFNLKEKNKYIYHWLYLKIYIVILFI
jgi:hypothetical protein